MEFLKNNWLKISVASIALTMAILYTVLLFQPTSAERELVTFIGAMQLVGPLLFFVGLLAYNVLKMFEKTKGISMYVILGTGVLATTAMVIGFFGFSTSDPHGIFGNFYAQFAQVIEYEGVVYSEGSKFMANSFLFPYIAMFAFFGLVPLLVGTKKVVCHFFCKDCKK